MGLGLDFSDAVRRGGSSGFIEPMPSCASNTDLSNGEEANSVEDGDMSPKLSAGSTSGEGCKGIIANSSVRGDVASSVGVVESESGLRFGGWDCAACPFWRNGSASTIFSTGTVGMIRPEVFMYAEPGFAALIARALCPGVGSGVLFGGQANADGADDGPGLRAGCASTVWLLVRDARPDDKGTSPFGLRIENGPPHSLMAELGVIGERPRSAESSPPRCKLVLNS